MNEHVILIDALDELQSTFKEHGYSTMPNLIGSCKIIIGEHREYQLENEAQRKTIDKMFRQIVVLESELESYKKTIRKAFDTNNTTTKG